jgi:glutaredoxin
MFNGNKIICPYCEGVNEPLDDESVNIEFTTMECVHCEKEFEMSRKIEVEYFT